MRQRFGIAQALLGDPQLIIVDEPTAGLDPEERRRFLNLLSEIGESVVVVLSTHIVEDVREVCSRMAIINRGRVLLTGQPSAVISELEGKVWQKEIARDESASYQANMPVLSTRLVAGRTLVHVLGDSPPGEGFSRADTDLEHVYFATLRSAQAPPNHT
jgi:ABC-type multidrug transport system ATPase subunit